MPQTASPWSAMKEHQEEEQMGEEEDELEILDKISMWK